MPVHVYRKRPIEVQAVRWTGRNTKEVESFAGLDFEVLDEPVPEDSQATAQVFDALHSTWVLLYTGDWIIRGIQGEFYPVRHAVFLESYEMVI